MMTHTKVYLWWQFLKSFQCFTRPYRCRSSAGTQTFTAHACCVCSVSSVPSPIINMMTAHPHPSLSWSPALTWGTALLPKMPLRMARHRPTMTSSLMFSMIPAASPATKANKIGAVRAQERKKTSWIIEIEHFDHTSWTWVDMGLQLSHEVRD